MTKTPTPSLPKAAAPSKLEPIPKEAKRGWELRVNGKLIENVESMVLANDEIGSVLRYGWRPSGDGATGYDTFTIHERQGGGAIVVPYAILEGKLMIGVVKQERPTAGGTVMELPRGYVDDKESHEEAAIRELAEETGLKALKDRFFELGNHANPDTSYFETVRPTEGARFYAIEIRPDEVELTPGQDAMPVYQFNQHIRKKVKTDPNEHIFGSQFIPAETIMHNEDVMTTAGVGLLLSHMVTVQKLRLVPVPGA